MKNLKKIVLVSSLALFAFGLVFVSAPTVARAVNGEGTATINLNGANPGSLAASPINTVQSYDIILTVGASGIAANAASPTFTIPSFFPALNALPKANIGAMGLNDWTASASGGTCAITLGSSIASGQTMTVDVTGACASGDTINVLLETANPLTAHSVTPLVIDTADTFADGPATPIALPPQIAIYGTATFANHTIAGVATTNNLVGLAGVGGTDKVLGGFSITSTGEKVNINQVIITVAVGGGMNISNLTNLRVVPDNGHGGGTANDGIMQAGELAAWLSTITNPSSVNNNVTGLTDTITAGVTKNYFITGTLANTVADGNTVTVEAINTNSSGTGVTSLMVITPVGSSTNNAMTVTDTTPPTVAITLSNSALSTGQTALVTFTFSETPTGFDNSDVTVQGGSLSTIDASNPLVETATFTPTDQTSSATNVITVGTSWTDSSAALNPPVGSTTSANYVVNTVHSTSTGGTSSGGGYLPGYGPRAVLTAPTSTGGSCLTGSNFDVTTGKPCVTTTTTSTSTSSGFVFTKTLKLGNKNSDVMQLQKYLNSHGFVVSKTGSGSVGNETTYFGQATKQALGLFQVQNKIVGKKTSKNFGIFGPATMKFVNQNQ